MVMHSGSGEAHHGANTRGLSPSPYGWLLTVGTEENNTHSPLLQIEILFRRSSSGSADQCTRNDKTSNKFYDKMNMNTIPPTIFIRNTLNIIFIYYLKSIYIVSFDSVKHKVVAYNPTFHILRIEERTWREFDV